MINPKDILVITTSSAEGLKIKQYLKPVSAHVVAGTNLFSDFFASITDSFGGRSNTYQKQLSSLYNEAIEKIKYNTHEIGGNCVVGLSVDMDEISGKGKSMFMITAIGTAVIIENDEKHTKKSLNLDEKFENVGVEKINNLKTILTIIEKAENGSLELNDKIWDIIISNQVEDVFPFIMNKYTSELSNKELYPDAFSIFNKHLIDYLGNLDIEIQIKLLYDELLKTKSETFATQIIKIIRELNLYDFNKCMDLLKNEDFQIKKSGLKILTCDKPYFNKQDVLEYKTAIEYTKNNFGERGIRSMKKQLLSKEKEVWTCECATINDIEQTCSNCNKDIYGFYTSETKPNIIVKILEQKIKLINEYLK